MAGKKRKDKRSQHLLTVQSVGQVRSLPLALREARGTQVRILREAWEVDSGWPQCGRRCVR